MGAALLMSSFLASARVLYDTCQDPGEFATRLGAFMYESSDDAHFVTGIVGCLDPSTGEIQYVNAGHPSGYLVRGREIRPMESTGVPFGILPRFAYRTETDRLRPGEMLALFSDGIIEAQHGDEMFDDERLQEALKSAAPAARVELVRDVVLDRLDAFLDGQPRSDDVTLVLIRREEG
jgi:sigma-B regulation protein RsbU (phosphoserine phosphatase)